MDRTVTTHCGNGLTITTYDASVITKDFSPALFNSCMATEEEIATLREVVGPDTPLSEPPRGIYSFSHFSALVQRSQSLEKNNICTAVLPISLAEEIISAQTSYLITGNISATTLEDIKQAFLTSKSLASLVTKLQSGKKWFVRMDDCSPKDSEKQNLPISSISELILCLSTSNRARGDFEAHIQDNKHIHLFLHPWDVTMNQGVEFRCFVPPWKAQSCRITAISQYHWYLPFPSNHFTLRLIVDLAIRFATQSLQDILATAFDKAIYADLKYWGFSFDIVVKNISSAGENAEVVEINPFGARSGCGSCLFHWERDGSVLYGGKEGVEVRIVIKR
ncbi:hypothetical protein D6D01_09998 [Aureobasidium pullulans]|uniref:Uncharacterized protein n=1 Tax=Aureobasidium pullulans TaxID=5580 RepID=A0A4S9JT37_AURPU|nr:hypothetical protein D6D01_09998 [Aureobasidium pullulans]